MFAGFFRFEPLQRGQCFGLVFNGRDFGHLAFSDCVHHILMLSRTVAVMQFWLAAQPPLSVADILDSMLEW